MELLFTMDVNRLLTEFTKSLDIEENVTPDEIVIECLRKVEMKESLSTFIPLIKDATMITDEQTEKCTQ